MSRTETPDILHESKTRGEIPSLKDCLELLGLERYSAGRLPFAGNDTTAGAENELQVAVQGNKNDVDLPSSILESNYFANITRRAASGDMAKKTATRLEKYISSNKEQVWENSWVQFNGNELAEETKNVFIGDLKANKGNPASAYRSDAGKYASMDSGTWRIRIPISYLLKLALADAISGIGEGKARDTGARLMGHFSNDNTSPETHSFNVVPVNKETGMGKALARETSRRYLFTHLLAMYANAKFKLSENGQTAMVFFSPHPPVRQKMLNEGISDSFYRELFMSPCLSGWDAGEDKHKYMILCHQVLSRSQLNALGKLREAGIINSNLVTLPNVSNISLANNGTHISLGSRRLTALIRDPRSGFTAAHEKYLGDLAIKITEHFLPLFAGTYSAAPYRLDFCDFHPERVLGFLPHQLDYTHLRMFWRRWKKKARNRIFGKTITPFGPEWIDKTLAAAFGLKGDYVPDFRLLDYLVALMSTEKSPALDGTPGNGERLKKDLDFLGAFDQRMSLYMLVKMREFNSMGFSGYEGRYYSQFHDIGADMGNATSLQTLVQALACKYIARGNCTHSNIPDHPFVESERRQIFFGAAAGLPTFYVKNGSGNLFLQKIIARTDRVRSSGRYPGYLRVHIAEYRKALVRTIRADAADLIEMYGMEEVIDDLERRITDPGSFSAEGKLLKGILEEAGARSPLQLNGAEFNGAAEKYYRETLKKGHLAEALSQLEADAERHCPNGRGMVKLASQKVIQGAADENEAREMIGLMLSIIGAEPQH